MDEESDSQGFQGLSSPPIVTRLLITLCLAAFVTQSLTGLEASPFFVDGVSFWQGSFWGLFSSFFVHINVIPLVVNLVFMWRLGTMIERSLGSTWFFCFWMICTSLCQLAEFCVSDPSGIGASGFCFAMLGFCLVAGRTVPELVLELEWVIACLAWFFIILVLSALTGLLLGTSLGNFAGFVVGCLMAYGLIERDELWIKCSLGAILLVCTIPCFYAPWSSSWNLAQAQRALNEKQFQLGLSYLDQVHLPDLQVHLFSLRASLLMGMGKDEEAAATFKTLLDVGLKDNLESDPEGFNGYAWLLATSTHDTVWNPQAALPLADLACRDTDYTDGELLDTLAAAYAGTGNFDEALKWEKMALDALSTTPGASAQDKLDLEKHLKLFEEHHVYRDVYDKS